ncbi:MAG TPA: histidine phosphatase family protein [Gammaproteobacteria bacterium]|nr:histidine phosphatase family protein [Gammaproteobacteria bacterium]
MSATTSSTTVIDLLRHGEPVGGRRYRGQTDDPLSEKGWQQMRAAIREQGEWSVIYSSSLKRCVEFARDVATQRTLPLHVEPRLMEIGFGVWEGRTPDDLRQEDPSRLERFWRDPVNNRPEGAETLIAFRDRVASVWQDILTTEAGKHVLIVGHAGITRLIMTLVLGSPLENLFRIQVDNAGLTRVRVQGFGADAFPVLSFHGRHSLTPWSY